MLSIRELHAAIADHAAIRRCRRLQPAGGVGDKLLPPTCPNKNPACTRGPEPPLPSRNRESLLDNARPHPRRHFGAARIGHSPHSVAALQQRPTHVASQEAAGAGHRHPARLTPAEGLQRHSRWHDPEVLD